MRSAKLGMKNVSFHYPFDQLGYRNKGATKTDFFFGTHIEQRKIETGAYLE